MISNEEFVRQSLELNLFFLRIMKEHAAFIEAGFTARDQNLAAQADQLKTALENLLSETVNLSNGLISPEVVASGELVTQYTLNAEKMTSFYTGIPINTNITLREMGLRAEQQPVQSMVSRVANLNSRVIQAMQQLVNFKNYLIENILACRLFHFNYSSMLEHLRNEALHYLEMLMNLQNRMEIHLFRNAAEQEAFWNDIMKEHAEFIRGLLDPKEEDLIQTANMFAEEFAQLENAARMVEQNLNSVAGVTEESLEATREIRDFKAQATQGGLACQIKSLILPLLSDHVLREANHYLRLLRMFEMAGE